MKAHPKGWAFLFVLRCIHVWYELLARSGVMPTVFESFAVATRLKADVLEEITRSGDASDATSKRDVESFKCTGRAQCNLIAIYKPIADLTS